MIDLNCPRCGSAGVVSLPKQGNRIDCECECCDLAFSISVPEWPAIRAGRRTRLVEEVDRIWLRPLKRGPNRLLTMAERRDDPSLSPRSP